MAVDGIFNLQSALERFLDRCPKVAASPFFRSLAKKGCVETEEEEVVAALAEVFLHPAYTIPLIGCFPHLIERVVKKVVSLLCLVGDLRSCPDDSDDETSLDNAVAEGVCLIDFYVRRGRCLELHESACLALSRALHLNPHLLGFVLNYFEFGPPPYERILVKGIISKMSTKVSSAHLFCLQVSYCFLNINPEVFSKCWDWACFLDFMRKLSECPKQKGAIPEKDMAVLWYGIKILSIIFRWSDRAVECLGLGKEEAFSCLLRWEEFCQDVEIEKAGSYIDLPTCTFSLWSANSNYFSNMESSGSNALALSRLNKLEPSIKVRRLDSRDEGSVSEPFVINSRVKKSFEMVSLAISQKRPVLLYGPSGSGKSSLIRKLAQDSGKQVLYIHMDDQLDGKTLVGTYMCTEQPGEFRWQPGSLTQAVMNGFWVVLEDIDKAPSDVPLILTPLLEGSYLFVTGHGEEIRVAEDFRLFSTISTSECSVSHIREGRNTLSTLWRRIKICLPDADSLQNIVLAWYPNLEPITKKLIETFQNVNSALCPQFAGVPAEKPASSDPPSRFSLRDLLKWCKRVQRLPPHDCYSIYQEAVDIFSASYMSTQNRVTICKVISSIWNVPISESQHKATIQDLSGMLKIGRVYLELGEAASRDRSRFVETCTSMHLLEKIACSVEYNEPVLLVGETGTGKTTLVQNLASWLGQKLTVLNLSQQSDIVDLLGGFKPLDSQLMCTSLYNEFIELARNSRMKDDSKVIKWLQKSLRAREWQTFLSGLKKTVIYHIEGKSGRERLRSCRKRKKPEDLKAWKVFSIKIERIHQQICSGGMAFTFVEGAFVTALKEGQWILLDEVNLAPPEILGRLIGVLEGENGSLCLAERGDVNCITRHSNFRMFACMNPATDTGKRDLPYSFRSRFTEYFVDDELSNDDLELFVRRFLGGRQSDSKLVANIICFYKEAKKLSEERLQDGANQKPQYSLRSLYRALEYAKKAEGIAGFQKAIYDGFSMFFLSLLDASSAKIMNQLIVKHLLGKDSPPVPSLSLSSYLGELRSSSDDFLKNYVMTKTVVKHLAHLAHAIFIKRYPVLLQGPTSSGKTSLVRYLAAITGHKFVRINNHEHTDIQEYIGSYMTDSLGKLVFHEGALVKAVRNGHWIVLDELNLAPSDVLEALNRLLDDNRELFVPELGETIPAHPDFILFATQNPPTLYGGRKLLSRAFRNRFVEIHVDEIPEDELSTILTERCHIAKSHALKMVEVMKDLQLHRQSSNAFAGKQGYVTPRDLFRWAERFRTFGKSNEDLAREGYYLLAERLRDDAEKQVVQEVLERHIRVSIAKDDLYKTELLGLDSSVNLREDSMQKGGITWTKSMWRLYFLIRRCYELREPVLLVGETGGGKTTICQLLSNALDLRLRTLNCHQYTETSDFLGGFYPVRDRSSLASEYENLVKEFERSKALACLGQDFDISPDINKAELLVTALDAILERYRNGLVLDMGVTHQDVDALEQMKHDVAVLHQKWHAIFVWQDGPLVQAMRAGDLFLVDEISLADDSVLERLNSVLEPEKKLSLAEKGGAILEEVIAHGSFLLLATMNPGGDYGKKELSPALRNRFTEIWVPSITDADELRSIAFFGLSSRKELHIVGPIVNFWEWFNRLQIGRTLTVRDLLSWITFVNVTRESLGPVRAILHGAFLVALDGLSLGTGISRRDVDELREKCFIFLLEQLRVFDDNIFNSELSRLQQYGWGVVETNEGNASVIHENMFGFDPFYIRKGDEKSEIGGFEFLAPTTRRNVSRVLRAMQLPKPILLEGSPGVGKTSLITALGKYSGHKVVRINLSEQADMMDLMGSDLPFESDDSMKFVWCDGILLQALKQGSWVLLDELNLAPQSVLEGLNAILDHRAQVFIPELGLTFDCPPTFRVFACQNPSSQGGGRKGLPKSFLNRFTKVYVDELLEDDYLFICSSLYPSIPRSLLSKLITFNRRLHDDTMVNHKFGMDGSPWEFNLRDVIRSCQLMQGTVGGLQIDSLLNVIYIQRMRTAADRKEVMTLYEEIFGQKPFINPYPRVQLNPRYLVIGSATITRNFTLSNISNKQLKIIPEIRQSMEAAAHCVQNQWLCILVGPSSSGKTSLIRLLAQLTGNVLNELNLSPATDISDLLGCFEQYSAFRNYRLIIARVERLVNEYSSLLLKSSLETAFSRERNGLVSSWLSFLSGVDSNLLSGPPSSFLEDSESFADSLSRLVEIIKHLNQDLETGVLPVSWSKRDLDQIMKTILKLQTFEKKPSARFEWVIGLLIKAIENGEWIVLENANLCNPTVLDRINSLVEPSGSITLNECGIIDGEPVTVTPHPDFRLFLSVNPKFGEVSRAMRNRGVEIFVMEPHWLLDEEDVISEELVLRSVKRFLALSGIPGNKLVESMAKAHVYAWRRGHCNNIQITYLELEQWVQLFQQLLLNGNQPLWSLQLSWEHIYLSSLGDADGKEVVAYACEAYLSEIKLSELDAPLGRGLCLPGGWPKPLNLRDFTWYSRENTVRQNCMYLEFLGAQYASHASEISCNGAIEDRELASGGSRIIYTLDSWRLSRIMFPKVVGGSTFAGNVEKAKLSLASKMLLYAANWMVEQATEDDIQLYLVWFSWFASKLQHKCPFFQCFLHVLKEELKHPIWNDIFSCRRDLILLCQVDQDAFPVPMLSSKLIDLAPSSAYSKSKRLLDSLNSVGVLRLSYLQWHAESNYDHTDESRCFLLFLDSLQALEKKILDVLVGSPSFSVLIQLYSKLIEDHSNFWSALISSLSEHLLASFWSLMKAAKSLLNFFPEEVQVVLEEIKNLDKTSLCCLREKSFLWAYGGHPSLPVSSELYHKQCELLKLCDSVWPMKLESEKQGNDHLTGVIAISSPELCSLVVKGLCMSSYISEKDNEDNMAAFQVDEIYQMLVRRLESERERLEKRVDSRGDNIIVEKDATCCVFLAEILTTGSGFNSWLQTRLLATSEVCSLDGELLSLLQHLLLVLFIDPRRLQQDLVYISSLLESALSCGVSSIRPPQTLVAHQKLLWTIDACGSMSGVDTRIAGFVLEMWYWWHSIMWSHSQTPLMDIPEFDGHLIPLPFMLIQPVKSATVAQILQNTFSIKDHSVQSIKLKYASRSLWKSSQAKQEMPAFLLSIARSLFQQIIYTHKKSFNPNEFAAIVSTFNSLEEKQNKVDNMLDLIFSIGLSSHQTLKSVTPSFVEPLIKHLYLDCPSDDLYSNLGFAWLKLGCLRFHLLHSVDAIDPATRTACKLAAVEEKIASLELNMKVREECDYLVGSHSTGESDKTIKQTLHKLKTEHKRLQRKIVFRLDPKKFKDLRGELNGFLGFIKSAMDLGNNIKMLEWNQVVEWVGNWQETAAHFIERLSNEYSEYADIAQPVQVAVYEMKLGLALLVSSASLEKVLNKIGIDRADSVMDSIYALMRFPRGFTFFSTSNLKSSPLPHSSHAAGSSVKSLGLDIGLLQNLSSIASVEEAGKVSQLQLKAVLYKDLHFRVLHFMATSKIMDKVSFELLHEIYLKLASIWIEMKFQAQTKVDSVTQLYQFRARDFKVESLMEVDISDLGKHFPSDGFLEWQEYLADGDSKDMTQIDQGNENLEDEWNLVQEPLDDIIRMHNELFGSFDLFENPGRLHITDIRRLDSFVDSYELGIGMTKVIRGLFTSRLDSKLVPEHILRLCLEHKRNFTPSPKSANKFNFYKDSDAPELGKMVKLLTALQQRVFALLHEREEHPGLQKLSTMLQILLDIPSSTPLAKALSGLQFLVCKVHMLQEEGCKFSVSDQLEPIIALASSWQKMEFECWPALLDEVQDQYRINARKLWLPLFSVLFQKHCAEISEHDESITDSLVEFIRSSNIGEFGTRLQLLFGFLVQLRMGSTLGTYSSDSHERNLRICYNVFGFYIQFLPIVMEQVELNRRNTEAELKELLKLCRWERLENYLSIEKTKRTREKLKKLIQKYTDMLQQPVLFVRPEVPQKGLPLLPLQGLELMNRESATSMEILVGALGAKSLNGEDGFSWYATWRGKVNEFIAGFHQLMHPRTKSPLSEDITLISELLDCQSSCRVYQDGWKDLWGTVARIGGSIIGCANLWRDVNKGFGKKRALSDLLKLLERSGLQKHRFEHMEASDHSNGLFSQPSYDPQHLMLTPSKSSALPNGEIKDQTEETSVADWKAANEFYFKSLFSVQLLSEISWKHSDFTFAQVNQSISFLKHLTEIQREQRKSAYRFAELLNCFRRHVLSLNKLLLDSTDFERRDSSVGCFPRNQHAILNCMWLQKKLFDNLITMLLEKSALLRTVESTHSHSCQDVKASASRVFGFTQKLIPAVQNSKDLLDRSLLGCSGAAITLSVSLDQNFVTKQMVELLLQNFEKLEELEEQFSTFRKEDAEKSIVRDVLLGHFDPVFKEGKLLAEQLNCVLGLGDQSTGIESEQQNVLDGALARTLGNIKDVLQKLCSYKDESVSEEREGNITIWDLLFKKAEGDLNIENLCYLLSETHSSIENVLTSAGNLSSCVEHLKRLHVFSDLVLRFGDYYLKDFLFMSKMVSLITHVLASVLAELYAKGFGTSMKDDDDDSKADKTQAATGTGMGEGAGAKDVSDQIEDEEQLLGTLGKEDEEQEVPDELKGREKGIEMSNEFDGETHSVSEDSREDDEDDGDEDTQLDSAMGEVGSDAEIANEKLWDKEEDEEPENTNEKYESGPSVSDKDTSSRELRAKEEDPVTADEPGKSATPDNTEERNGKNDDQDDLGGTENLEDKNLNKEEAFADPTGLKPDADDKQIDDSMEVDEKENEDVKEDDHHDEPCPEDQKESEEFEDGQEFPEPGDEAMEGGIEDTGGSPSKDHPGDDLDQKSEMEPMEGEEATMEQRNPNLGGDNVPSTEAGSQTHQGSQVLGPGCTAPQENWSNGDVTDNLAAPMDLPSGNNLETNLMVTNTSNGETLTDNVTRVELPKNQSSAQQTKLNPYRNVGDALKEWKERVRVSTDIHGDKQEIEGEVEDRDADEYGFVSQPEAGSSQALGPATSEQVNTNMREGEPEGERLTGHRDEMTEMDIDDINSESKPIGHSLPAITSNIFEQVLAPDSDLKQEEDSTMHDLSDVHERMESVISVDRSFSGKDAHNPHRMLVTNTEMRTVQDPDEEPDGRSNATVLWRKYELLTTKLSQELAEQLCLIMEPTLASKLQGDYRTGKRINMKKVIPYIASQYRKDKIWLRRTKPNKREYQVVIAVDDSRSMSESSCGEFAIRALATVCRAMSQLEMGNLAVTSFGKEGNMRLLHDFGQSFTSESGAKMISSLTFEQENLIKDEPVVNLLTHLNDMLDTLVAKSRLPSGNSPLQQLVLIIGDGKFHEKEKLKRCVRNFLSKKRMVAFLLLDNAEESVLDLKECIVQKDGSIKFIRYMDAFPFPYYIVLRDIEALPRTLASLLRQWFELMQSWRD